MGFLSLGDFAIDVSLIFGAGLDQYPGIFTALESLCWHLNSSSAIEDDITGAQEHKYGQVRKLRFILNLTRQHSDLPIVCLCVD